MPKGVGNVIGNVKGQVERPGGGNKKNQGNDALITKNSASLGRASAPAVAGDRVNLPKGQEVR